MAQGLDSNTESVRRLARPSPSLAGVSQEILNGKVLMIFVQLRPSEYYLLLLKSENGSEYSKVQRNCWIGELEQCLVKEVLYELEH